MDPQLWAKLMSQPNPLTSSTPPPPSAPSPPRKTVLLDERSDEDVAPLLDEDLRLLGQARTAPRRRLFQRNAPLGQPSPAPAAGGAKPAPILREGGAMSTHVEGRSFDAKPSQRLREAPHVVSRTMDIVEYSSHIRSQYGLAGTEGACTGFGMAAAWYFLANTQWAALLVDPELARMEPAEVRRRLQTRYRLSADMDIEFLEELGRIVYFGMLQRTNPEAYQRGELPWISAQNQLAVQLFGNRFEQPRRKQLYAHQISLLQRAPISLALPSHLGISQILAYGGDEIYVTRNEIRSKSGGGGLGAATSRYFISERRSFDPRGDVPKRLPPEELSRLLLKDLNNNIELFKDVLGPTLLRDVMEVATTSAPTPASVTPPSLGVSRYQEVSDQYAAALASFMASEFGNPEKVSPHLWTDIPFEKRRASIALLVQLRTLLEARISRVPSLPSATKSTPLQPRSPQLDALVDVFHRHADELVDQLVVYSSSLKVAEINSHTDTRQEAQHTIQGISAVIEQAVALQNSQILRDLVHTVTKPDQDEGEAIDAASALVHAPFAIVFSRNQTMTSCLFKDGYRDSPWVFFDSHGTAGKATLKEFLTVDALHELFRDTESYVANIYLLARDEHLALETTHANLYQEAFGDVFDNDMPEKILPYVWSSV